MQSAAIHLLRRLTMRAAVGLGVLAVGAASPTGAAAAPAPQGMLVFASNRTGVFQLYSIRADGSQLGQLTHGKAADTAPLLSPDGRRSLFIRSPKQNVSELWVMNANGSGQRKLAAHGYAPTWSPDSRRIAYVDSPNPPGPLAIEDVESGRTVVVSGKNDNPYWSPNGRLIAFSRQAGWTYCCVRRNLMVVSPDGRKPTTVRTDAAALGWSAWGEIAFTGRYGTGVALIGADRRGARPLLRGKVDNAIQNVVWSPDGRRLAFVRERRLYTASSTGRSIRDVTAKLPGWSKWSEVTSPAWSPDGRWIVVRGQGNLGSDPAELLLVAGDGSSWQPLTARLARPWGSDYEQPSWRPLGATPIRLGGSSQPPLPLERVSASTFQPGSGTIRELAADGGGAAVVVDLAHGFGGDGCAGVEVWEPAARRIVRLDRTCNSGGSVYEPSQGLALAGTRAAWLGVSGGNTTQTDIMTATVQNAAPAYLAEGNADSNSGAGTWASKPVGRGTLLAFIIATRCDATGGSGPDQCPANRPKGGVVATTVWRVGGREGCGRRASFPLRQGCTRVLQVHSEATLLAVDAGRIVVHTDGRVRLLSASGNVLRDIPLEASAAALSGKRLALRTADALEIYDTGSGRLTSRLPVAKAVSLADLGGAILVTTSAATVALRSLANGRTVTLHTDGVAKAKLTDAGLFFAGARRVTFMPMGDVLRRLSG